MKKHQRIWAILITALTILLAWGIGSVSAQTPFIPFGELDKVKIPPFWASDYQFWGQPVNGPGFGGCGYTSCLRAEFVRDVTIPDGSFISPGKTFMKTWRIRNAGTCTWTKDFYLIYVSGTAMTSVQAIRLPHAVAPGKTVDISVSMTAPTSSGAFQSNWMLRSANGQIFGVGCNGMIPVWASITTAYAFNPCQPCVPTVSQPVCVTTCNGIPSAPIYNQPSVTYPYGAYPSAPKTAVTQNTAARNPYCNNKIRSINDISIRDGSKLAPNEIFRKTWRMKNAGTCIWDQGYTLIFTGGDAMGGKRIVNIPKTVYPGETVELSIDLQAPSIPGHYRGYYMLQDSIGYTFGYGSYANTAFWVDIYVDGSLAPKSVDPAAAAAIEAPLLMEETTAIEPKTNPVTASAETDVVVLDSNLSGGNACGNQRSEVNFIAPDTYEVSWYLTNTGTNKWDPEHYAIVNTDKSAAIDSVVADIAPQPTSPGEETRISFTVKVKTPGTTEPLWTKFHLENNGTPFCDVYFPLN